MKISYYFILILSVTVCWTSQARASENGSTRSLDDCSGPVPMLQSDRPTLLGLTKDSNDNHSYLDINISLHTPMFYDTVTSYQDGKCNKSGKGLPYFGLNLVAAFYATPFDYRPSRPVVGKVFNPYVRYRYFMDGNNISNKDDFFVTYLDGEYGHMSNGQDVTTLNQFNETTNANGGNQRYAEDYISRGWDYFGVNWRTFWNKPDNNHYNAFTVNYRRYFGGMLQREVEEFNPLIEQPRAVSRLNQVSGLRMTYVHAPGFFDAMSSAALTFESGNNLDAFKYISTRIDTIFFTNSFHTNNTGISIDFWAKSGYATTLAHYYERTNSIGVAFLFETFKTANQPSRPLLFQ